MLERQLQPTQLSEFKRADQTRQNESLSLPSAESPTVLKPAVKEELTFISPFDTAILRQDSLEQAYFFWKVAEARLQKYYHESKTQSISPKILTVILD